MIVKLKLKCVTRVQVNNLSLSLLSLLLLPRMIKTSREYSTTPRLVVVSSEVHFMASLDRHVLESPRVLETIGSKEYCSKRGVMGGRYPLTKRQYMFTLICLFHCLLILISQS